MPCFSTWASVEHESSWMARNVWDKVHNTISTIRKVNTKLKNSKCWGGSKSSQRLVWYHHQQPANCRCLTVPHPPSLATSGSYTLPLFSLLSTAWILSAPRVYQYSTTITSVSLLRGITDTDSWFANNIVCARLRLEYRPLWQVSEAGDVPHYSTCKLCDRPNANSLRYYCLECLSVRDLLPWGQKILSVGKFLLVDSNLDTDLVLHPHFGGWWSLTCGEHWSMHYLLFVLPFMYSLTVYASVSCMIRVLCT